MKQTAAQQPQAHEPPAAYVATPPGFFPSFADINALPREERHAPLEAWVVWINAHRGRMDPELERQLDEALGDLDAIDVAASDVD